MGFSFGTYHLFIEVWIASLFAVLKLTFDLFSGNNLGAMVQKKSLRGEKVWGEEKKKRTNGTGANHV